MLAWGGEPRRTASGASTPPARGSRRIPRNEPRSPRKEILSRAPDSGGILRRGGVHRAALGDHGFGPWALDVRGDFAGFLGLKWVPPDMPFAPAVELLYRLIPRFWGQGLATEGSLAALEFGFCELHLDAVVAFAVQANTGSRRVMEKVGMVHFTDFDHPLIPELSPLRRHVPGEWVVATGGGFFFSPSISAIRNILAKS